MACGEARKGSSTHKAIIRSPTKPMNDSRRLVVSDLLCYMVNNYSRVACKRLKSAVNDFYNQDEISTAKEKLSVAC